MTTDCPECGGTGFRILTAENGATSAARCLCSYRELAKEAVQAAGIPRRYEHCRFETFESHRKSHQEALEIARDWVERWPDLEYGHSLLLAGPPGRGKTHLAVAILRHLADEKGARVRFWEQRALLKKLQGTFDSGSAVSEAQILGPVHEADLLVLDDLGAGRTSEWARDVLHEIITYRYDNRKSLILTTNCPLGEEEDEPETGGVLRNLTLRQRLGDALMSRLYEMCRFVRLEGDDYRKDVLNARIKRI